MKLILSSWYSGVERHAPVSPVVGRKHDGPPLPEAKSDGNYILM